MNLLDPIETTDILLKVYPTYQLYAKVAVENKEAFLRNLGNSELILYRFCMNGPFNLPDYKAEYIARRKREREEHLQQRLTKGFKCL